MGLKRCFTIISVLLFLESNQTDNAEEKRAKTRLNNSNIYYNDKAHMKILVESCQRTYSTLNLPKSAFPPPPPPKKKIL